MPQILPLSSTDSVAWDRFVCEHPLGTPFHLTAWRDTITDTFAYQPHYLAAYESGRLTGVLPLFHVRNVMVGKALISSPFAVYGGVLASSDAARSALHQHAVELGRELGVDYVEFRNSFPEQCVGEPNIGRYVSFQQLTTPDENTLLESLPKKTRNMVRKSLKQPFTMRYDVEDYTPFIELYSKNMRRLGTPTFPVRHFENLRKYFGSMIDVREVLLGDRVVAASLNFYMRGQMHIYYAAADTDLNALAPNTYMYFDHLRWAGQNGCPIFDFGRCKRDTGVFEFKRHWNTQMRELPYQMVMLKGGAELPNLSPANPKFDLAIKVWRNLPLPVTRVLGPPLIRLFP